MLLLEVVVKEVGTPDAEGGGLLPVDAYDRIGVVTRVPEVSAAHGLVVRVSEVGHPDESVRIYEHLILLEEAFTSLLREVHDLAVDIPREAFVGAGCLVAVLVELVTV